MYKTTDKHTEVATVAKFLMDVHGLHNWNFRFNMRKTHLGNCFYPLHKKGKLIKPGRIELSYYFVKLNQKETIFDIIMHEIAHALTPGHCHDEVWQAKAKALGATPNRICNRAIIPNYTYRAMCYGCYTVYYRYRQVRNAEKGGKQYCKFCGPKVGFLKFKVNL
jgi:predicted SprT family Zn-dependent metalloprotease